MLGLLALFGLSFAGVFVTVETMFSRHVEDVTLQLIAQQIDLMSPDAQEADALWPGVAFAYLSVDWSTGERTQSGDRERWVAYLESERVRARHQVDGREYVYRRAQTAKGHQVSVVLSVAALEQGQHLDRNLLWILFALTALVATCLSYGFLTFLVLRPVRALGLATQRVYRGDLASPVTTVPRNEFGALVVKFNHMLAQLGEQRRRQEVQLQELASANEQLRQTQASLVRSAKLASVGQLAAGVAHEVGNPLAALIGYNELLLENKLEPEDREAALERSRHQLGRIQSIIGTLLDYSRSQPDEICEVNLNDQIQTVIDLAHGLSAGRRVDVVWDRVEIPLVSADPNRVEQVFLNLLINAFDAVADVEQPRVTFRTVTDSQWVSVCVEDNGPGLSKGVEDRVFDPFFTTKEPGAGTGLGLSIAHHIVGEMDGKLEVVDGQSVGACFCVRLPRRSSGEPDGRSGRMESVF